MSVQNPKPHYLQEIETHELIFDKALAPEMYEQMLGVFREMRERCSTSHPYDDVLELRSGGKPVAWTIFPKDNHKRVIFYDNDQMWAVVDDIGRADVLEEHVPDQQLQSQ